MRVARASEDSDKRPRVEVQSLESGLKDLRFRGEDLEVGIQECEHSFNIHPNR